MSLFSGFRFCGHFPMERHGPVLSSVCHVKGSQTHQLPSQADGAVPYQPTPESQFRSQLTIARLGLRFGWLPTWTLFHRAEP